MIDGRPNNPYGVMLGMWGGDASDYASIHFQWASDVIGDWGHVRVGSGVHGLEMEGAVRTLAICRAKHLIPVMTGLYVPEEYQIPGGGDHAPYIRDDGYPKAAERYGQWAQELAKLGAKVPYYELGNEINGKWKAEAYGKFIIAINQALKAAMPDLKMTSAGLAGNGAGFLTEVLTAVPEAKDYIDCYGLHPYGANHPPAFTKDGYCLKGHLWTAEALAKFGIDNPQFVMTESGYELRNKRDHRYPRITDELRAEYMVEAYKTFWEPDPRVVTLTIFMLQAVIYPGWDGWILIDTNCNKTETYKALQAVPKPPGSDWMPHGDCSISGRITDADSQQGLERVFLYTVPGIYAAETDADGNYTISDLPDGSYEIRMFRTGFVSPPAGKATVAAEGSGKFSAQMKREGFLSQDMGGSGPVANGWIAIEGNPDAHYKLDKQVKFCGSGSQMLAARPEKAPAVWTCTGYATAVPDKAFTAEVWVKGQGVKLGNREGASLALALSDSGAQELSVAKVNLPLEGDFDWTPLNVTIGPYPVARRLKLTCKFDAEQGKVWFDQPYCHYADYPVPSRTALGAGTAKISGEVIAEREERMADAAVFLRPGNYWAMSRSDGTYEISGVPAGAYDIYAFRRGKIAEPSYGVVIADGADLKLDLEMRNPPAPREVHNGDFEHRGESKDYTPGWIKFGEFDGIPLNGWHPEVPGKPDGFQSHSGEAFAGSIAGSNVKNGGLYQILEVTPDKCYEVSVWSYTYQTDEGHRGDVANRLGVDPTGGTDPNGPYVIWTPYMPSHDTWTTLSLKVAPLDDRMTIFLDAKQVHGLMFNVNCFDDVTVTECAQDLPAQEMVITPAADYDPSAAHGAGPQSTTRDDIYRPPFLWGLTAPGVDPIDADTGADDIGPPMEKRKYWTEQSGATYYPVGANWKHAEPERLPEEATEEDFDWTEFDKKLQELPPRMAGVCGFSLNAPWANEIREEDEDEYWRLAERFMEFAARRAHANGVIFYKAPGNEPSLTMRSDWAEMYMKPVRHYAAAIHRGHPDNQLMAGALVVGDQERIDALYRHGFKEHVDILDIHAYATSPGEKRYFVGLSQILESHRVLEEHGDGHKKIYLGEGWSVFPLPPHIDLLKEPPTYTEEDFEHYRKTVVYGYAALTTPREGYDPNWLMGASFFCLNDLWGSMSWAKRATIEYDENGDPAFWLLDGYKFPYAPGMMDPQFRTWGLIDIEGNPKGDIIKHFPPYIPRHSIRAELADEPEVIYPGVPYTVDVSIANKDVENIDNLRFSADVFKGDRDAVTVNDPKPNSPGPVAPGQQTTHKLKIVASPGQVGKNVWLQCGCEYDWLGEPYYTDAWLKFKVASPGGFRLESSQKLPASAKDPAILTFRLTDKTGADLPAKLQLKTSDDLELTQTTSKSGSDSAVYSVTVKKKDASQGGYYTVTAAAGSKFHDLRVPVAFPRPGSIPEKAPAVGRLINPGFEEFGPGSGFEGWDGPPSNWADLSIADDLPDHGERLVVKAYCGTKYGEENSQVVTVPVGFAQGDTVSASAWCKGVAMVDATDHTKVRFRISVEFRDSKGKVLKREDSPLKKGTGKWEKLEFTTGGAPAGTETVRLILRHENLDDHSWHMAGLDNAQIRFNSK